MKAPETPLDHTIDVLRSMREETQRDFAALKRSLGQLTAEIRISNPHIVNRLRFEDYASRKLAELNSRLQRIEKRLKLINPTMSPELP